MHCDCRQQDAARNTGAMLLFRCGVLCGASGKHAALRTIIEDESGKDDDIDLQEAPEKLSRSTNALVRDALQRTAPTDGSRRSRMSRAESQMSERGASGRSYTASTVAVDDEDLLAELSQKVTAPKPATL